MPLKMNKFGESFNVVRAPAVSEKNGRRRGASNSAVATLSSDDDEDSSLIESAEPQSKRNSSTIYAASSSVHGGSTSSGKMQVRNAAPLVHDFTGDDDYQNHQESVERVENRRELYATIRNRLVRLPSSVNDAVHSSGHDAYSVGNFESVASNFNSPLVPDSDTNYSARKDPMQSSVNKPETIPKSLAQYAEENGPAKKPRTWPNAFRPTKEQQIGASAPSRFDILEQGGAHQLVNWPYTLGGVPSAEGTVDPQTGELVRVRDEPNVPYGPTWIRSRMARLLSLYSDPIYRFVANTAGLANSNPSAFWKAPEIFGTSTSRDVIPRSYQARSRQQPTETQADKNAKRARAQAAFERTYRENSEQLSKIRAQIGKVEFEIAQKREQFNSDNQDTVEGARRDLIALRQRLQELQEREKDVIQRIAQPLAGARSEGLREQLRSTVPAIQTLERELENARQSREQLIEAKSTTIASNVDTLNTPAIQERLNSYDVRIQELNTQIDAKEAELSRLVRTIVLVAERESVLGDVLNRANPADELSQAWLTLIDTISNSQRPGANQFLQRLEESVLRDEGARRLLGQGEQGQAVSADRSALRRNWMSLPENLGMFLWSPDFDVHLNKAYKRIMGVNNKSYYLYDLMTQGTVNTEFAELVANMIKETRILSGTRYQAEWTREIIVRDIIQLIRWFSKVDYTSDGRLVHDGVDPFSSPIIDARRAALEAGGNGFSQGFVPESSGRNLFDNTVSAEKKKARRALIQARRRRPGVSLDDIF